MSGWKEFKISELFITEKSGSSIQVPTGAMISKRDLEDGNIPRVTVSNFNNGITGYYKDVENKNYRTYENFISVSFLGTVFYQPEKTSLDMKVHCLMLKNKTLNTYIAQFLVAVIKKVMSNFAYADQLSSTVLPELYIKLPALTKYIPDFDTLTHEISGGGINMNKIDTSSWKEFEISELFDIHPTKNLGLTNHELFSTTGNTPVVVNSSCNNGIGGYVDLPATEDGGIITFSDTTDANSIFYQKENFIGYSHVQGMYPKFDNNSDEIMQYIMTVFKAKALTKGYNYSNKFRRDDALKIKILLQAKTINEPDWQFMEDYIKEIQKKVQNKTFKQKGHRKKIDVTTAGNKTEKEWEKYRIGDLFKISLSKDDIQPKLVNEGSFPLVSSGKENNGICAYIEKQDAKLWNAGLLTVDMFGKAFYQEKPFYCVSHGRVNILIPKKDMSEMSLRFIGAVIEKTTMEKYDFQEMCTGTKLAEEFVFLPSGDNGQPDWDGIKKFMCSIADNSRDTLSRITLSELQDIYKKVTFASGGRRWKRFHLYDNELFSIDMGNKFDKSKMDTSKDEINFIGRTGINNGINALCGIYNNIEPYNAGYLTLSLGGSIGSCFIQNKPFYTSQNVIVLIPRNNMSFECKLFISVMIYKESNTRYKAFSDELNRHIKTDFEISLPVDSFGNPDWDYMENYIKELIAKTPKNIDLLSKVF